jgi:L-ascorbate metabolism protein UlaG (beta-lactamase superfamily)
MRVEWYGQSAFHLSTPDASVAIDPFADMSPATSRGMQWEYPAISGAEADLLLVTHEHYDHNGIEVIGGSPEILRSTAGRLPSPIGEVLGIASEHDERAGTERGHNTIFCFELDGLRICHLGDLGQSELRDEQLAAIGAVDLLFIPVGDMATIGARQALAVVERLAPRWVVPMHYRTHRIGFLEPADAFIEGSEHVERLDGPVFDTDSLSGDRPLIVVPAAP